MAIEKVFEISYAFIEEREVPTDFQEWMKDKKAKKLTIYKHPHDIIFDSWYNFTSKYDGWEGDLINQ